MTSKDDKKSPGTKKKKGGPLSVSDCNNAKTEDKLYRLKDTNGLYLEVKPSGNKVWRYRFEMTQDGKRGESMYTIGDYAYVPIGKETDEEAVQHVGLLAWRVMHVQTKTISAMTAARKVEQNHRNQISENFIKAPSPGLFFNVFKRKPSESWLGSRLII